MWKSAVSLVHSFYIKMLPLLLSCSIDLLTHCRNTNANTRCLRWLKLIKVAVNEIRKEKRKKLWFQIEIAGIWKCCCLCEYRTHARTHTLSLRHNQKRFVKILHHLAPMQKLHKRKVEMKRKEKYKWQRQENGEENGQTMKPKLWLTAWFFFILFNTDGKIHIHSHIWKR